ncbi:beta-alanyl-bioamine nonribosomal peptide synthetase ebony isoform X1 [Stomoxys calcitrans]|uniref:beta-alanyl-bioamine nonribosomal peptide synthetase ebony isoform X1 n=1 Tax=Stomoxys calcitrans TaxID=35570 RepID=UPI0027E32DD0|nr:beta-alanyl-bioamine nonribosomal peptide synthetase ebony isoform X1 [Stomoxys calcitrans]
MGTIAKLSIVKGRQQELVPRQLHRIFEEGLSHRAQKTALIHYNEASNAGDFQQQLPRQTSYQEMNRRANQCARILVRETTQRFLQANADGDFIIAVCMQPSDDLVTTLLAIWKAGAAYLPIDPSFPTNRIQHIMRESKPILVIADDNVDKSRFGPAATVMTISELSMSSMQVERDNLRATEMLASGASNLAIVLYTSGSTGVPKGVRLPHEVILNRLQWQWTTFPYALNETVGIFKTALTFVDSVAELWGPLLCGLAILVVPKVVTKDPERLVQMLEKYKIRRLVLVPTLLRSLLMYLNLDGNRGNAENEYKLLYNLQIWVCSGEPLPLALASNFYDYFQEGIHALYNFYGSTEVMGDVTYFCCENKKQLQELDRVPIGIPVNNTVVYLLDTDYRPVKNGEIGEIFVSGLNLADGYVNGRDKEKFVENPLAVELSRYSKRVPTTQIMLWFIFPEYSRIYRTGDYGSLSDGFIFYEGRTDSQIKIRGHRVDLSEVEKNVAELPPVEKAIVLCYNAGQIDQALLAFVKLRDDSPLYTELQLESKLSDKLAEYMIPQVVLIDQVPLLVNGKIDRQALLKQYETANNNEGDSSIVLDFDYSQVPDELRPVAQDLFETVGSVIGRSTRATLAPHSNFYELGGNSLNSIFTVTVLREKGYSISISEFIAAKNLGEILNSMTKDREINMVEDTEGWISACPHLDLEAIPLQYSHKADVIQIIVDSFYGKADLEQWLKPDILRTDYSDLLSDIWNDLVEKDLSFVVKDKNTNRIIGTALNFDARNEPEVEVKSKLIIVFEFLEFVEGPIRDTYLPKGLNKILHSFMMGTHVDLNPQENIACMHFMEYEVLKVAKNKEFAGILTTNTSPLTQQLGNDVYNYKTLLDYQVNEYVYTDGTQPFGKAPDSQRAIVHWKEVTP